jgi:ribonucleoside-diphosphate reductase alpha chain
MELRSLRAPVEIRDEWEGRGETTIRRISRLRTSGATATCGALMVRNGSCYKCLNCGGTSGCS